MRSEPFNRLVDDGERQFVTRLGVVIPGEQAVAFQHDALGLGIGFYESLQVEAELKARTAPGKPANVIAEDLLRQLFRVFGGGNRDDRIGMHVVDMIIRYETVQRRIDGGRARIEVEGAMRQEADHAVLILDTLVNAL
ncbi:hypothetical protein D3C86_1366350 [compost metagenome]